MLVLIILTAKKTIYEYLGSKFRKMRAIDKEDRACIKSNDEGD
jgi:hypothetical protein